MVSRPFLSEGCSECDQSNNGVDLVEIGQTVRSTKTTKVISSLFLPI